MTSDALADERLAQGVRTDARSGCGAGVARASRARTLDLRGAWSARAGDVPARGGRPSGVGSAVAGEVASRDPVPARWSCSLPFLSWSGAHRVAVRGFVMGSVGGSSRDKTKDPRLPARVLVVVVRFRFRGQPLPPSSSLPPGAGKDAEKLERYQLELGEDGYLGDRAAARARGDRPRGSRWRRGDDAGAAEPSAESPLWRSRCRTLHDSRAPCPPSADGPAAGGTFGADGYRPHLRSSPAIRPRRGRWATDAAGSTNRRR